MNLNELENFTLANAIEFNDDLNPQLYTNDKMRPRVRAKLMEIAEHFRTFIGIEHMALVDVTVSGSNAAYTYTPHSDIDLHLIVDFSQLSDDDVYKELFDAKKYQYNDMYTIKLKGYDVELYVQDAAQPHRSLGEYSIMHDTWNRIPTRQRANLDDNATQLKYQKLRDLAVRALASDNAEYLNNVLDVVKRYRSAGLDEFGEFGPENLAFKMLRKDGFFTKLWAKKREHEGDSLSLETTVNAADTDLARDLQHQFQFEGVDTPERMVKKLYAARNNIFDEYDYDTIYEDATRLSAFEATYPGNVGAMEIMQFYQVADARQISLLQRLIAAGKGREAWKLIQRVTGTDLDPAGITEGVGLIRKGSNVTPDVGEAQTRKEAEKLGFKTTDDGVPPTLKANGKT